jgi:hypothetical protein
MKKPERLLYFGSDIDLSPILLYPKINDFVYIDQTPRNYEAHWGVKYYKGLYIPSYRPDCGDKDMVESLIEKIKKKFKNVKSHREGDKLVITFDKKKKLTYWLNTLLPNFTFKNQFKKIKKVKSEGEYMFNTEAFSYFDKTNLTKEIIDDMLKCNILYIRGYYPSFPIIQMLKLDKIITQDYIISYYYDGKDGGRGKKYGEIDLRKPYLNYKPPKEIDCRDDLFINVL